MSPDPSAPTPSGSDPLARARDTAALRAMTPPELDELAAAIRGLIVTTVAARGGHLGSNLGAVELTIALHRVFDSPRDRLLFDTGHQAYAHKILTGRREAFGGLRTRGGLSGYPCRAESEHDVIENSHASTSLAYADGLAKAHHLAGHGDRSVVAVIGDGALTGGMAWEAMNNIAGCPERPVVIVLNDNGRSYSPTIGGLADHLADSRGPDGPDGTGRPDGTDRPDGPAGGALFRALGLAYLGPVDGHDLPALETALRAARDLARPVVVHVITRKGFGYGPAEADEQERFHAPGLFDPATGVRPAQGTTTWTDVFAEELARVGAEREDVVGITAAMLHPTGLNRFAESFPDRVYDVGIAEQHAVASAAGLALGGLHPVVAVYATFLNRAFDQVLLDVALHRAGVTFVLDRAGVTGDDGPSHNGMWDMSILQVVPGLRIAAPRDGARLAELLREALEVSDAPTVVRFPKGPVPEDLPAVDAVGGLDVLCASGAADVLIVAAGPLAGPAVQASELLRAQGLGATVVDPRWVKPLDPALVAMARQHRLVAVAEDNSRVGGVGDAVARLLRDADVDVPVRTFGIPPRFPDHAKRAEILADMALTSRDMARRITEFLARRTPVRWPMPSTLVGAFAVRGTAAQTETEQTR